jgi:zinc transport system substrate-binding protein
MNYRGLKFTLLTLFLISCGGSTSTEPLLVATLFPQYSLAESLAGDLMDITWLVPAGVDPHEYEPTPSQRVQLNNADVILFSSEAFEPWIHSIEDTSQGKLIDLSSHVNLLTTLPIDETQTEVTSIEDEHDHDGDPHYWVDPNNGIMMLEVVAAELILLLPEHQQLIESRQLLIEEALQDAVTLYDGLVPEGEELDIVFAGHNALGYLVNYDIHVFTPYPGFSSDIAPTAQSIIDFNNLMASLETNLLYVSSTDNAAVTETLLDNNPLLETAYLYTMETINENQLEAGVSYQELLLMNYEAIAQSEN